MRSYRHLFVALSLATTACAARQEADPAAPGPSPDVAMPLDVCADFNERRGNVNAAQHERTYGCPPCACVCVNGEINCAPCLPCVPNVPEQEPVPPPLPRPGIGPE